MSTHPHFDDKGAVAWMTDLDAARAEAKRTGRLVLAEIGREA